MLHGVKLHIRRVRVNHNLNQHKDKINAFRGKEKIKMKNTQTSFLIDKDNILWTMEYDMLDNSVVVTSDVSPEGRDSNYVPEYGYAVVGQYSVDNALGHAIPNDILSSCQELIEQDATRKSVLDLIISSLADAKRVNV